MRIVLELTSFFPSGNRDFNRNWVQLLKNEVVFLAHLRWWSAILPLYTWCVYTDQYLYLVLISIDTPGFYTFLSKMAQSKLPNVRERQLWLSSITAQRHSRQAGTFELHYFASDSDLGECNYPGQFFPPIASVFQSAPAAWTHFGSRLHWGTKESSGLTGPHREEVAWSTLGSGTIMAFNYLLSTLGLPAFWMQLQSLAEKFASFHIEGVIKNTAANWLFSTIFPAVP